MALYGVDNSKAEKSLGKTSSPKTSKHDVVAHSRQQHMPTKSSSHLGVDRLSKPTTTKLEP